MKKSTCTMLMQSTLFLGSWFLLFAGASGQEKQIGNTRLKTQEAQLVPADIARLIGDLGSPVAAVRETASKRLRESPGALSELRRHSNVNDLETKRRIEAIIAELSRKRFHQRMSDLAKQKADAPVDLLMELLVQNRHDVGDEQWKQTIDIVTAIAQKLTKGTVTAGLVLDPNFDLRKCRDLVGQKFFLRNGTGNPIRSIADSVTAQGNGLFRSVAIVSANLDARRLGESVVLAHQCVMPSCSVGACFFYCDGDIQCDHMTDSVIVSRGRVHCKTHSADNKLIENAAQSDKLNLFSPLTVGLKLAKDGAILRITNVASDSWADKSGMKTGDVIELEEKKNRGGLSDFEWRLREYYAKEIDMKIQVRRNGIAKELIVLFAN